MPTIINGSSPSITFSDTTTQDSAGLPKVNPTITSGTLTFPNGSAQTAGADLINNTGASSDITLNMGQTAYVTFTSSTSIPLRIATQNNQIYEINICSTGTSGANQAGLTPNNSSSWAYSTFQTYATSSPASGNANFNFVSSDTSFRLSIAGTLLNGSYKVFTSTIFKSLIGQGRDTTATTGYGYSLEINSNDTTTAWTSLGTIGGGTPLTGTVWIRRIG
jgi:hypothetical protein